MGDEEKETQKKAAFSMPPPPKPLSFEMPKPPVLQPNVAALLNAKKAVREDRPSPTSRLRIQGGEAVEPSTLETEIPITPIVEAKQISSPAVLEVSSHADTTKSAGDANVFTDKVDLSGGLMSWLTKTVAESKLLNDVAERAKASVETVITTLDPGMKPFLAEHGVIEFALFNCDSDTVVVASDAFTKAGAMAISRSLHFDETAYLANFRPLVLGEQKARRLCEAKAEAAKKSKKAVEEAAIVVLQPFLLEISGRFYATNKILLRHGANDFDAISQLLEVPLTIVEAIQRAAKSEGLPDEEYSISVSQAIKNVYKSSVNSWEPGSLAPYDSKELLSVAFSSLAQQLLRNLAPVN
ncbi:unnamed protein product [Caenorhabditis sp. 36 PRJEB53466]|nr:unnamed protein product [Caenorhabditis sp. 36 PRJEB53466]